MQGLGGDHHGVQSIAEWLEDKGLDQYKNNFRVNGFDNLDFLVSFSGVQGGGGDHQCVQSIAEWLEDQ